MLPLTIRAEAEADIESAVRWYDDRREGLGTDFLLCLEAALSQIQRRPKTFSSGFRQTRWMMMRRFPYLVVYRIESAGIVVHAVYHSRRDPSGWQERLVDD